VALVKVSAFNQETDWLVAVLSSLFQRPDNFNLANKRRSSQEEHVNVDRIDSSASGYSSKSSNSSLHIRCNLMELPASPSLIQTFIEPLELSVVEPTI